MWSKKGLYNKLNREGKSIRKYPNGDDPLKIKLFGKTRKCSKCGKRSAAFLRDWASLAFMGKVVFSAVVDAARPIMVNGIHRTFKDGLGQWAGNMAAFGKAAENVKYMGVAAEVTLGSARKRIIEDVGLVGRGKSFIGRGFDKIADIANNAILSNPNYSVKGRREV